MVERLIGSIRRQCLDHVIILNGPHLRQILSDYLAYYHQHRPHKSLDQDCCPVSRPVEPPDQAKIIELPLLGGLHHRYTRQLHVFWIDEGTALVAHCARALAARRKPAPRRIQILNPMLISHAANYVNSNPLARPKICF